MCPGITKLLSSVLEGGPPIGRAALNYACNRPLTHVRKTTQTVLVKLAFLLETPVQDDDWQTDDRVRRFTLRAFEVLEEAFADDPAFAGELGSGHVSLDPPEINPWQCSQCGQ